MDSRIPCPRVRVRPASRLPVLAALLLPLLVALLGACSELNRTIYSRALERETRVTPGVLGISTPAATTSLPLDAADLELTPVNARTSMCLLFPLLVIPLPAPGDSCFTTAFHLLVQVRPRVAGVSFDPSQVVVHTDRGSFPPDGVSRLPDGCPDCPGRGKMPPPPPAPEPVESPTWFDLRFPVAPPDPAAPFAVDLKGLRAGEGGEEAVSLRFEKASRWSYHLLPLFR